MNKCTCNSKCYRCWSDKDTKELYLKQLESNRVLFNSDKIDRETYLHNLEHINKYER